MMKGLELELQTSGVRLQIVVEARATVRDRLRAGGLARRMDRFTTVADAVDAALAECRNVPVT